MSELSGQEYEAPHLHNLAEGGEPDLAIVRGSDTEPTPTGDHPALPITAGPERKGRPTLEGYDEPPARLEPPVQRVEPASAMPDFPHLHNRGPNDKATPLSGRLPKDYRPPEKEQAGAEPELPADTGGGGDKPPEGPPPSSDGQPDEPEKSEPNSERSVRSSRPIIDTYPPARPDSYGTPAIAPATAEIPADEPSGTESHIEADMPGGAGEKTEIAESPGLHVELTPTREGGMVPSRLAITVSGVEPLKDEGGHKAEYVKALNLAWLEAANQAGEMAAEALVDHAQMTEIVERGLVYQRAFLELDFEKGGTVTFEGPDAAIAYEGVMRGLGLLADFQFGDEASDTAQSVNERKQRFIDESLQRINYTQPKNEQ